MMTVEAFKFAEMASKKLRVYFENLCFFLKVDSIIDFQKNLDFF